MKLQNASTSKHCKCNIGDRYSSTCICDTDLRPYFVVSNQFRQDALRVFYTDNKFVLGERGGIWQGSERIQAYYCAALNQMNPEWLTWIRRLEIRVHPSGAWARRPITKYCGWDTFVGLLRTRCHTQAKIKFVLCMRVWMGGVPFPSDGHHVHIMKAITECIQNERLEKRCEIVAEDPKKGAVEYLLWSRRL